MQQKTERSLPAFAKAMRKSYLSSKAGTKGAERTNVLQSAKLQPFWPPKSRPVEIKT